MTVPRCRRTLKRHARFPGESGTVKAGEDLMSALCRREFAAVLAGSGFSLLAGCGPKPSVGPCPGPEGADLGNFLPVEERLLAEAGDFFEIVERSGPDNKVLRSRARAAPESLELDAVARKMVRAMEAAGGVGIAGPQVGLGLRIVMLKLDYKTDNPYLLFVRNPVIVERSDETVEGYEGCLSIPDVGGLVRRNRRVVVEYTDSSGERTRQVAVDHNAVLWQHEIDHLDGVLYVDRLLGELLPMDEVRRLRRAAEKTNGENPEGPSARNDALEGAPVLLASAI